MNVSSGGTANNNFMNMYGGASFGVQFINDALTTSSYAINAYRSGSSVTSVVINEDSVDCDFRVESDGNANMLFVDGGKIGRAHV